jgi:acyl-CoA thioesterase-2
MPTILPECRPRAGDAGDWATVDLATMMALEPHGTDVWVGEGPSYPWGGLYGGQIVAQGLRAAMFTVEERYHVHSLHAYFIRPGDASEPIRFEVDRVRNGRSFCTRHVTARQSIGVILEMSASFQVDEQSAEVQTATMADVPRPDELEDDSWSELFARKKVPDDRRGEAAAWMRVTDKIAAADEWHLQTSTCHGLMSSRGVSVGYVFTADGTHVATVVQEVLLRTRRQGA